MRDGVEGAQAQNGDEADTVDVSLSVCAGCDFRAIRTYNPPSANTAMRQNFCRRGSWSWLSTGIGSNIVASSSTMFIPALVNQIAVMFMQ